MKKETIQQLVESAKLVSKCGKSTGTVISFVCWGGGALLIFTGTGVWIATHK